MDIDFNFTNFVLNATTLKYSLVLIFATMGITFVFAGFALHFFDKKTQQNIDNCD